MSSPNTEDDGHAPERFPREDRIRARRDFLRVQQGGKRIHTSHFVIIVLPAPRKRLGITVTKRVAGAVARNGIKRRVREVYRRNRDLFPDDHEVVVIARRGADQLRFAQVAQELLAVRGALQRVAQPPARQPAQARRKAR